MGVGFIVSFAFVEAIGDAVFTVMLHAVCTFRKNYLYSWIADVTLVMLILIHLDFSCDCFATWQCLFSVNVAYVCYSVNCICF